MLPDLRILRKRSERGSDAQDANYGIAGLGRGAPALAIYANADLGPVRILAALIRDRCLMRASSARP